jgi:hypothetical protein
MTTLKWVRAYTIILKACQRSIMPQPEGQPRVHASIGQDKAHLRTNTVRRDDANHWMTDTLENKEVKPQNQSPI